MVKTSEAVVHQLNSTCRLWVILWVTTVAGLVTSERFYWVLATSRDKVIDQRDANPWQEDASWEVVGSNPCTAKGFFLLKSLLNCAYIFLLIIFI